MLACPILAAALTSPTGFACTPRKTMAATAATGTRVTTAFHHALARPDRARTAELRGATLAFATTLKGEGLPPEQVLVSLKEAIARSGWWPSLFPAQWLGPESQTPEYRTYSQAFAWFLEGYFGVTPAG